MTSVQRVTQLVGAIFGHKFFVAGPYGTNRKIRYHIKYEKDDETSCLIIDVESNFSKLHIDSLAKCGPTHDLRSGTMLLNMVDALVKLIPECKTITLQDASYVKRCSYDIDLASLTILLTGISWYNHLGYKQPSYESEKAQFSTWLFTIAKNLALQAIKNDKRNVSLDTEYDDEGTTMKDFIPEDYGSDLEMYESNDIKANILIDQISKLKEPYRTVIEMREIKKMSYKEISDSLGKNLSTIKSQIRNGRSILINETKGDFKKIDEVYEGRRWKNCIDTIK